jgi:hypothetical protein
MVFFLVLKYGIYCFIPLYFDFFWSCGYVAIVFLFCKQWYDWIFATVLHICTAKRVKDTERKPLGHLYLGFTHTLMSSAVQTLTQVKARTGIMAVVVYSCG